MGLAINQFNYGLIPSPCTPSSMVPSACTTQVQGGVYGRSGDETSCLTSACMVDHAERPGGKLKIKFGSCRMYS